MVPGTEGPGFCKVRNVGRAGDRQLERPLTSSVAVSGAGGRSRPASAPPPLRPRPAPPSLGVATSALSARAVMGKKVAAEVGLRLALFAVFM